MFKVSLYNGYNTNSITDYKRLNPEHRVSFMLLDETDFKKEIFLCINNKDFEIFNEKMEFNEDNNSYYIDLNFITKDENSIYVCTIRTKTKTIDSFLFKINKSNEKSNDYILQNIENQIKKIKNEIEEVNKIILEISKNVKKSKNSGLINSTNILSIKDKINKSME